MRDRLSREALEAEREAVRHLDEYGHGGECGSQAGIASGGVGRGGTQQQKKQSSGVMLGKAAPVGKLKDLKAQLLSGGVGIELTTTGLLASPPLGPKPPPGERPRRRSLDNCCLSSGSPPIRSPSPPLGRVSELCPPSSGVGPHLAQHAMVNAALLRSASEQTLSVSPRNRSKPGNGGGMEALELVGSPEQLRKERFPGLKPSAPTVPRGKRRNSVDNAACLVSPRARRTATAANPDLGK